MNSDIQKAKNLIKSKRLMLIFELELQLKKDYDLLIAKKKYELAKIDMKTDKQINALIKLEIKHNKDIVFNLARKKRFERKENKRIAHYKKYAEKRLLSVTLS